MPELTSLSQANWTPLHIAARKGDVAAVDALLKEGATVDPRDKVTALLSVLPEEHGWSHCTVKLPETKGRCSSFCS